jgi:hypothetical protein
MAWKYFNPKILGILTQNTYVQQFRQKYLFAKGSSATKIVITTFIPGANPTTLNYSASVVKIYSATNSVFRIHIFLT